MDSFLTFYEPVKPTTWVILSSLLMVGVYFKFGRLWSLRNLDLIGLILLAPGMLLVIYGREHADPAVQHMGYVWLFSAGGLFLVRLLFDPMLVRRPLLEPNLSVGGMTFIGVSLFVFLMANVATSEMTPTDVTAAKGAGEFYERKGALEDDQATEQRAAGTDSLTINGPGFPLLFQIPRIATRTVFGDSATTQETQEQHDLAIDEATVKLMAILSHLAVVVGIVLIGYRHFDNYKTGVAAALLYLMLPYTARETGNITHVLPAALLVWAVATYRRPLVSGMLMGLVIGAIYYPLYLLPLWFSFYWSRGAVRFLVGVLITVGLLVLLVAIYSDGWQPFFADLRAMFGLRLPESANLEGFWDTNFNQPVYRIPVLAAFVVLAGSLALWPAQKNLGTLMSCSAAVMLGTQFWHSHHGGLYIAWYLPLLLLTVFRPNLEDRVALSVLGEGWRPNWRGRMHSIEKAA